MWALKILDDITTSSEARLGKLISEEQNVDHVNIFQYEGDDELSSSSND